MVPQRDVFSSPRHLAHCILVHLAVQALSLTAAELNLSSKTYWLKLSVRLALKLLLRACCIDRGLIENAVLDRVKLLIFICGCKESSNLERLHSPSELPS